MKSLKTALGIIFYKNRIAVAQCSVKAHAPQRKTAQFMLSPEQADLNNLLPQAESFKHFLKENGFRPGKAIVGLDAGRVFTTVLNLPAAADRSLNEEMIRIQLERKTQFDVDETVFGYIAAGDKIFVAAALKKQLEQILSFLQAVGIRVAAVTCTSMAIAAGRKNPNGCCILEYPESAELVSMPDGQFAALQNVTNGGDLSAVLPRIHQQVERLCLTMNARLPSRYTFLLSRSSAAQARSTVNHQFQDAGVETLAADAASDLPAVYAGLLADRAAQGQAVPVNVLTSMQRHRTSIRSSRWMPRAVIAAAAVLLLVLFFALEWHLDRRRIDSYTQQLNGIADNVKTAQVMIDRAAYARQWFDRQPLYLDMLMELTGCFPEQKGIWLNSLAVDESLNQIITGKASGEQAVLDVVDGLKSSSHFQDVKILYIRQAGKNTREETFAISFHYTLE